MAQQEDDLSSDALRRLTLEQVWLENGPERKTADNALKAQSLISSHVTLDDSIDAIRHYVVCVTKGITPAAAILAHIGVSLRRYLDAEGALSLDQAFGLENRQRVGHPLPRRIESDRRSQAAYAMWQLRDEAAAKGESLSIEAAAGQVINALGLTLSEETLRKHYSTIDADGIFGAFRDAMIGIGRK